MGDLLDEWRRRIQAVQIQQDKRFDTLTQAVRQMEAEQMLLTRKNASLELQHLHQISRIEELERSIHDSNQRVETLQANAQARERMLLDARDQERKLMLQERALVETLRERQSSQAARIQALERLVLEAPLGRSGLKTESVAAVESQGAWLQRVEKPSPPDDASDESDLVVDRPSPLDSPEQVEVEIQQPASTYILTLRHELEEYLAQDAKQSAARGKDQQKNSQPAENRPHGSLMRILAAPGRQLTGDLHLRHGPLVQKLAELQVMNDVSRRLQHLKEETEDMPLELSMWGCAMLVGIEPVIGRAASVYVVFLIILAVSMQTGIIVILGLTTMTKPDFDDQSVEELRTWRRQVAHHVSNYDPIAEVTLVRKICAWSDALSVSATIEADYRVVQQYLTHGKFIGSTMCIIALLSWYMTLGKEISESYETSLAMKSIPSGERTEVVFDAVKNLYHFKQLSYWRRTAREAMSAIRLCVAGFLTYQGTQYLVYTIAVEELLLNAVALEFVIKLDELIYDSLAPATVKRVIQRTVGFKLPTHHISGIDLRTVISFILVILQMSYAVVKFLSPQLDVLTAVEGAICGGDSDFVYAIDGMGSLVWGYPPSIINNITLEAAGYAPWPDPKRDEQLGLNQQTINSILQGWGRTSCPRELCYYSDLGSLPSVPLPPSERAECCLPGQTRAPSIEFGRFSVQSKATASLPETSDMWNAGCADILNFPFFYSNLLQGEMGRSLFEYDLQGDTSACGSCDDAERPLCKRGTWNGFTFIESASEDYTCANINCADVLPYCHRSDQVGIRARMMCSSACGCDEPRSSLAFSRPVMGCPIRCDRTAKYKAVLSRLPCEDVNKTDANFVSLLDHMEEAALNWPFDWRAGGIALVNLIRQEGCAFFQLIDAPPGVSPTLPPDVGLNVNLCVRNGGFAFPFKALSIFCPVSCGCRSGFNDCPDSCPALPTARAGNFSTRVVEYHNLEPNYILPASAAQVPDYVQPPHTAISA